MPYSQYGLDEEAVVESELEILYDVYDTDPTVTFDFDMSIPYNIAPTYQSLSLEILWDIEIVDDPDLVYTIWPATGPYGTDESIESGSAALMPEYVSVGAGTGGPGTPTGGTGASTAGRWTYFVGDYYEHVYVRSDATSLYNVQDGDTYEFSIYNAFPEHTLTLTTINATGDTGVTQSISVSDTWDPMEDKPVTLTFGSTVGLVQEIEYEYIFTLSGGGGTYTVTFELYVERARTYENIPELPIEEIMEWRTDVLVARDGTEQRIALRGDPRRTVSYRILIGSDAERRDHYSEFYDAVGRKALVPWFQYHTFLTASASSGVNRLYFDSAKTNMKAESYIALVSDYDGSLQTYRILTVHSDGVTIYNTTNEAHSSGEIVAPAVESILDPAPRIDMSSVSGYMMVEARAASNWAVDTSILNPYHTGAVVHTTDNLPALEPQPLSRDGASEIFIKGSAIYDNDTSILDILSTWNRPQIAGERLFLVDRIATSGEIGGIGWWNDFLYRANGMQKPFLAPTWRDDLLVFGSFDGTGTFYLQDGGPMVQYFDRKNRSNKSHAYLAFINRTTGATIYRRISDYRTVLGRTRVSVTENLASLVGQDVNDIKISFANLSRLASDTVIWRHEPRMSYLSLQIRTIDG
jgi:hypothetical protein